MALSEPPRLAWSGRYSDGRTAALCSVEARIGEDGLTIAGADGALREIWPCDDVRLIDGPDASGAIRIAQRGRDARLSLQHGDALRALEMHCPALRHGMGGDFSWRVVAIWAGAAIAAMVFLIFGVVPFLADHAGQWVSPRLEAKLGDQLAEIIIRFTAAGADKDHAECSDPEGRAALDKLAAPLAAAMTLRNPLRLRVINSRLVNAIALPGGQILLFKGLIDFAEDPNEVAGVIAHEMGHLQLDHPLRVVIQQSGTAFVIGLALGDIFGGSALAVAGTAVLTSAFSREAESAADGEAVALMAKAGYDLGPFGNFFKRLGAKEAQQTIPIPFLRSHPPSEARAAMVAGAPAGGRQALSPREWQALKAICR